MDDDQADERNAVSQFMQELIPVVFMYACVLALGPFIAGAMWLAFDGDRLREDAEPVATTATEPAATRTTASAAA